MNQNTEIIIFTFIVVGISIILIIIYMFPKISNYIEKRKENLNENDLKLFLNEKLSSNFIESYKSENIDPILMISLQQSINSMTECFTKKLIEYYNKNNIYNIKDIIEDIKNNNIPYNFNKGLCKNSIIAGLDYLVNKYGSNFNIQKAINFLTNQNASNNGFNVDNYVYDSNIITSTGDSKMYNFSKDQLDYLNKYIN